MNVQDGAHSCHITTPSTLGYKAERKAAKLSIFRNKENQGYGGNQICHVNGVKYAGDVVQSVFDYRMHELGLRTHPQYAVRAQYTKKWSAHVFTREGSRAAGHPPSQEAS